MNTRPDPVFPLVLAAPSGTGKTTIVHALVHGSDGYTFSVSATTRAPREGEKDGVDYHFVDRETFTRMADAGELVEWAEVHGELYGTPRSELAAAERRGEHVVLDIDVQGARQIRDAVPGAVLVFVLPPSVDTLKRRLAGRGTESRDQLAARLRTALKELEAATEFDYIVVNDELDRTLEDVWGIVRAERRRTSRAIGLEDDLVKLREAIGRLLEGEYSNVNATRG